MTELVTPIDNITEFSDNFRSTIEKLLTIFSTRSGYNFVVEFNQNRDIRAKKNRCVAKIKIKHPITLQEVFLFEVYGYTNKKEIRYKIDNSRDDYISSADFTAQLEAKILRLGLKLATEDYSSLRQARQSS